MVVVDYYKVVYERSRAISDYKVSKARSGHESGQPTQPLLGWRGRPQDYRREIGAQYLEGHDVFIGPLIPLYGNRLLFLKECGGFCKGGAR
jgi:hypothetical protein